MRRVAVVLLLGVLAAVGAPAAGAASLLLGDHALLALTDDRSAQPVRARGGELVSSALRLWRIDTAAALELAPALEARGALRYAEADLVRRTEVLPSDPLSTPEIGYHLYRIGADRAEPPAAGFPLTIVDTGLLLSHPEFANRPDTVPLNEQSVRNPSRLESFHGTIVSSTAAAPVDGIGAVGVYPQATLRVYDAGDLSDAALISGIETAIAAGPSVINISLGGTNDGEALHESLLHAFASGSLVVAAAGNEYTNGNPTIYPAAYPHVLTVGSTGHEDRPSRFSSGSPGLDLVAPGEDIPVQNPTDTGYQTQSGTSFSAPMVAAAAAWVRTVRPDLDMTQLFDVMRLSARDVFAAGYDERTGYGILDIPGALAVPAPAPDVLEPNDDVDEVTANRVFRTAKPPLNGPRGGAARIAARLDPGDDPHDVYRLVVPARKQATVSVTADEPIRCGLITPSVRTVSAIAPKNRLAPGRLGRSVKVTYANRTSRSTTILVDLTGVREEAGREINYRLAVAQRPVPRARS